MAKMPLAWHKTNLINVKAFLAREQAALEQQLARFNRLEADALTLENQIAHAELEGKDGFDAEKYLKKKVDGKQ